MATIVPDDSTSREETPVGGEDAPADQPDRLVDSVLSSVVESGEKVLDTLGQLSDDTAYIEWIESYDQLYAWLLWGITAALSAGLPVAFSFNMAWYGWLWWGFLIGIATAFRILRLNNNRFAEEHEQVALTVAIIGVRLAVVGGLHAKLLGSNWSMPVISASCSVVLVIVAMLLQSAIPSIGVLISSALLGFDIASTASSDVQIRLVTVLVILFAWTAISLAMRWPSKVSKAVMRALKDPRTPLW